MATLPTLDPAIFAQLKNSWETAGHFLLNDPATFDQGIVRAIDAINSIPQLVVVSSCEGNPRDKFKNDTGHISVGVLDPEPFHRIFALAVSYSPDFPTRFGLATRYRKRPMVIEGRKDYYYPTWSISWRTTDTSKAETLKVINRACEEIAAQYS